MIQHFGVKLRFDISAAVGDAGISGVQLFVGNAVGDAAQGQRLLDIGEDLSVDFLAFFQRGKAEVEQIIKSQLGGDLCQCLNGHDVHGLCDSLSERRESAVSFSIPVCHGPSVRIVERCVVHHCGQGQAGAVKGRRIG